MFALKRTNRYKIIRALRDDDVTYLYQKKNNTYPNLLFWIFIFMYLIWVQNMSQPERNGLTTIHSKLIE